MKDKSELESIEIELNNKNRFLLRSLLKPHFLFCASVLHSLYLLRFTTSNKIKQPPAAIEKCQYLPLSYVRNDEVITFIALSIPIFKILILSFDAALHHWTGEP